MPRKHKIMLDLIPQYLQQFQKILIIEDDSYITNMYVTKLSLEKFQVITASDGATGLRLAKHELPDVIILDIMLPVMDGWNVLQQLRGNDATKDIPVILLTNLSGSEDVARGKQLGATEYLVKAHYIPSEIVKKIKLLS